MFLSDLLEPYLRLSGGRNCQCFSQHAVMSDDVTSAFDDDNFGETDPIDSFDVRLSAADVYHTYWVTALALVVTVLVTCIFCDPQSRFYQQGLEDWINDEDPTTTTSNATTSDRKKKATRNPPEAITASLHSWKISSEEVDRMPPDDCSCPICLMDFEPGNTLSHSKNACRHRFHETCIREWMHTHSSCPCCRQDLILPSSPSQQRVDPTNDNNLNLLTPWPRNVPPNDPTFCLFIF